MTKKNTLYYLTLSVFDTFNFSKDQDFVLHFDKNLNDTNVMPLNKLNLFITD